MEDKTLIFLGTFGLIIFNVLVIIVGIIAFNQIPVLWATLFVIFFGGGALYFDFLVARYFYYKIKGKINKKNE